MLCNTGGQTDTGSSQNISYLFVYFYVGIDPNFPQKSFFALLREKFRFSAKIILA